MISVIIFPTNKVLKTHPIITTPCKGVILNLYSKAYSGNINAATPTTNDNK